MPYAYVNGQSEKVDDLTMLQNTLGSSLAYLYQMGFMTILTYAKQLICSFYGCSMEISTAYQEWKLSLLIITGNIMYGCVLTYFHECLSHFFL